MFKNLISKISIFLSTIVYIIFFYFLNKYSILPVKYRFIVLGLIFLLIFGFSLLIFKRKKAGKPIKAFFIIVLLFVSAVEGLFISYASTSIQTVQKINQKKEVNKTKMSFVVLKESPIETLDDLNENQVAIAKQVDKENVKQALEK